MRSKLGRIQTRLARLEFLQREQEFTDLEGVLTNYEAFTPEEEEAVFRRLLCGGTAANEPGKVARSGFEIRPLLHQATSSACCFAPWRVALRPVKSCQRSTMMSQYKGSSSSTNA